MAFAASTFLCYFTRHSSNRVKHTKINILFSSVSYNHTLSTNGNLRVFFQTIYWLARKINSDYYAVCIQVHNGPFYSCMLGYQAFEQVCQG